MDKQRNSCSKSDSDTTLIHTKEDYIPNEQLKSGYNAQFAMNSKYITGVAAFTNRTDSGTLLPFLKMPEYGHHMKYI